MAEHAEKPAAKAADAGNDVPGGGDHDRVTMLSLRPDGTPAQHNPEIIGDKEFATEAAKRQFAEQAISARDVELRGATDETSGERDSDVLKKAHDEVAAAAEKRAEATVDALHRGVGD